MTAYAPALVRQTPAGVPRTATELLVERAQHRDADAVGELYAQNREAVTRYLSRLVGNRDDADDLAAETFLRVFQAIEHFRPRGRPFSSWVYRIAHNVAMDHFRATNRAQKLDQPLHRGETASASAEDEALEAIAHRKLLAQFDDLSRAQREVLVLVFVHALSNRETGRVLGKSEGSVKAIRYRALMALKRNAAAIPAAAAKASYYG